MKARTLPSVYHWRVVDGLLGNFLLPVAFLSALTTYIYLRILPSVNPELASPKRIRDRLADLRRSRFVGRGAEIELFRRALGTDDPDFLFLYIFGPGGIGKSSLLQEYATIAKEMGRTVFQIDGRNIQASPDAFLSILRQARQLPANADPLADWPATPLLLIDTYEMLAVLDKWLRETVFPHLPDGAIVVLAGRNPPAPAWHTEPGWAEISRIVALRNLGTDDSIAYLSRLHIPPTHHPDILRFTRGFPLALALLADLIRQQNGQLPADLHSDPNLIQLLLARFADDISDPQQRAALAICCLAWATTEQMLADQFGPFQGHALFEWLRSLSFIEQGPFGLFPHDLAREVLIADFQWRLRDDFAGLRDRLTGFLRAQFERATPAILQRIRLDLLYLRRYEPAFAGFFDWDAMDTAYAQAVADKDLAQIESIVLRHEGAVSIPILRHWWRVQRDAFLIYRDSNGECVGFLVHLLLNEPISEDLEADPALAPVLAYAQANGAPRPAGELISLLRFWMHTELDQQVSPALNLTAVNTTILWTTTPDLAWSFVATRNGDFLAPHFAGIDFHRAVAADFTVDHLRYQTFAHDWRVCPPDLWMRTYKGEVLSGQSEEEQRPVSPPDPPVVFSQSDFAEAVRQALRDYTRPDLLRRNPLLDSALIRQALADGDRVEALQQRLRQAVDPLADNPKDAKLYRALRHTYFDPLPTQEQAAEFLNLPFNTYRYHLANGIERLTAALWQQELDAAL